MIAEPVDAGAQLACGTAIAVREVIERARTAEQQVEAGIARRSAAQVVEVFLR